MRKPPTAAAVEGFAGGMLGLLDEQQQQDDDAESEPDPESVHVSHLPRAAT